MSELANSSRFTCTHQPWGSYLLQLWECQTTNRLDEWQLLQLFQLFSEEYFSERGFWNFSYATQTINVCWGGWHWFSVNGWVCQNLWSLPAQLHHDIFQWPLITAPCRGWSLKSEFLSVFSKLFYDLRDPHDPLSPHLNKGWFPKNVFFNGFLICIVKTPLWHFSMDPQNPWLIFKKCSFLKRIFRGVFFRGLLNVFFQNTLLTFSNKFSWPLNKTHNSWLILDIEEGAYICAIWL